MSILLFVRRLSSGALAACVISLGRAAEANAQTRAETIHGRVATDSGRTVIGADVILTMAPNRETFRGTTDSAGRYEVKVAGGTGDYLVYIGGAGWHAFRKRIMRSGTDSVFVVDAILSREVTTVAAVRTTSATDASSAR